MDAVPPEFVCSISQSVRATERRPPPRTPAARGVHEIHNEDATGCAAQVMKLPASVPTGETFDYEPLLEWIARRGSYPTDPTRALSVAELMPNLYLRCTIEEWVHVQAETKRPVVRQLRVMGP